MSLENKVVIITGAASGIGRACAKKFANNGAKIVVADINEDRGEKVAEEIRERGQNALFVSCNVSERLDVRNLIAHTIEAFDKVDVLVNNAATIDSMSFVELTEAEFDRVLSVNLKGCFLLGQAVACQMIKQIDDGGAPGSIINMSSVNQVFALPDHVAYSVSKGGLHQLTKAMALALASHGIRVNAIGPGSIQTPVLKQVVKDEKKKKQILSRTPLGRIGQPSEIAAIAVFLASNDASYITGETIYADGGRLALNYTVDLTEPE